MDWLWQLETLLLPYDGDRGNADWGIIVDSVQLANNVRSKMAFDEESMYVQAVSPIAPTNSYSIPEAQTIDQATATSFTGTYSGQLPRVLTIVLMD